MTQTIRFKKLRPDAVTPTKANAGDAGWDLTAVSMWQNANDSSFMEYRTGIAVELPQNYAGLLFSRSSVSNTGLILANGVGLLDANYRGEIKMRFKWLPERSLSIYDVGDRIGQLVIVPIWSGELVEADELSETERGAGGFGSSGK